MKLLFFIYSIFTKILLIVCHKIKMGKNTCICLPSSIKNGQDINIGENCFIGKYSRLYVYSKEKGSYGIIKIGNNFKAQRYLYISCAEKVTIGNDVLMAGGGIIIDNDHGSNPLLGAFYTQKITTAPVSIGDNCWLGKDVIILKGVTIGSNTIIGAGSVVTKNIPDYCIAVGNPAKVIKKWNFHKNKWEKLE